ncbi:MAG TPA: GIY-YIG nuclease family protein [Bacteroidia bacterium]|jgi:putative endonuclease|nr:GIY-YIG nuclease family protein [Bacteroidia bacterium]
MKHFVYILKSLKDDGFYYGYSTNVETRLNFHNEGLVRSTKGRRPFILHYVEEFLSKSDALRREKFFKSIDGYNWLKDNNIT